MHLFRVAIPSSSVASGSWYLPTECENRMACILLYLPVKQTESKVAAVAVSSEGYFYEGSEVIDPVQVWCVVARVVTTE